jgi:hypothetical protein
MVSARRANQAPHHYLLAQYPAIYGRAIVVQPTRFAAGATSRRRLPRHRRAHGARRSWRSGCSTGRRSKLACRWSAAPGGNACSHSKPRFLLKLAGVPGYAGGSDRRRHCQPTPSIAVIWLGRAPSGQWSKGPSCQDKRRAPIAIPRSISGRPPHARAKHGHPAWAVSQRSASSPIERRARRTCALLVMRRAQCIRRQPPYKASLPPGSPTIAAAPLGPRPVGSRRAQMTSAPSNQSSGLPTGGRMDRCSRSMTKISASQEHRWVDQILTNCWFFRDSPRP